jgi:hypothetical protein
MYDGGNMAQFILKFEVASCPVCSCSHIYEFVVRTLQLFGGESTSTDQMQNYNVLVPCLTQTDVTYEVTLKIPRHRNHKISSVKQKTS